MIDNNRQLAATLFQMESFADTLEGMRRHAQETEPSIFTVTASGFVSLLRERIAEAKAYVESLSGSEEQPSSGDLDFSELSTVQENITKPQTS